MINKARTPTFDQYNASDSPVSSVLVMVQRRTPELIELINTAVTTALSKLSEQVTNLMDQRFKVFDSKLDAMEKTIHDMEIKLAAVMDKVEDNEVHNRRDNLIIKGMLESTFAEAASQPGTDVRTTNVGENSVWTLASVLHFFTNSLSFDVRASDISVTYRLPKSHSEKYRQIIVKFSNRRARDKEPT